MRNVVRIARTGRLQTGKLCSDGLAEDHAAGAANERHHGGVCFWTVSGVNRRAVLGWEIGGVVYVLDAYGKPAQRQGRQPISALARRLNVERHERADLGLALCDHIGTMVNDRARGERASLDLPDQLERGQHHDFPSSRAMMRSVRRRAPGMITN